MNAQQSACLQCKLSTTSNNLSIIMKKRSKKAMYLKKCPFIQIRKKISQK
jgi:hypothetical protein